MGGAVTAGTFGLTGGGVAGGALAGRAGSGLGGAAREIIDYTVFDDEFEVDEIAIDTGIGIVTGPISVLPEGGDEATEKLIDLAVSLCAGIWIPTGQVYGDFFDDLYDKSNKK